MFDVLVEAAAQRKISRERKGSRGGQTVYDVLVEATVERMGGQTIKLYDTFFNCVFKVGGASLLKTLSRPPERKL